MKFFFLQLIKLQLQIESTIQSLYLLAVQKDNDKLQSSRSHYQQNTQKEPINYSQQQILSKFVIQKLNKNKLKEQQQQYSEKLNSDRSQYTQYRQKSPFVENSQINNQVTSACKAQQKCLKTQSTTKKQQIKPTFKELQQQKEIRLKNQKKQKTLQEQVPVDFENNSNIIISQETETEEQLLKQYKQELEKQLKYILELEQKGTILNPDWQQSKEMLIEQLFSLRNLQFLPYQQNQQQQQQKLSQKQVKPTSPKSPKSPQNNINSFLHEISQKQFRQSLNEIPQEDEENTQTQINEPIPSEFNETFNPNQSYQLKEQTQQNQKTSRKQSSIPSKQESKLASKQESQLASRKQSSMNEYQQESKKTSKKSSGDYIIDQQKQQEENERSQIGQQQELQITEPTKIKTKQSIPVRERTNNVKNNKKFSKIKYFNYQQPQTARNYLMHDNFLNNRKKNPSNSNQNHIKTEQEKEPKPKSKMHNLSIEKYRKQFVSKEIMQTEPKQYHKNKQRHIKTESTVGIQKQYKSPSAYVNFFQEDRLFQLKNHQSFQNTSRSHKNKKCQSLSQQYYSPRSVSQKKRQSSPKITKNFKEFLERMDCFQQRKLSKIEYQRRMRLAEQQLASLQEECELQNYLQKQTKISPRNQQEFYDEMMYWHQNKENKVNELRQEEEHSPDYSFHPNITKKSLEIVARNNYAVGDVAFQFCVMILKVVDRLEQAGKVKELNIQARLDNEYKLYNHFFPVITDYSKKLIEKKVLQYEEFEQPTEINQDNQQQQIEQNTREQHLSSDNEEIQQINSEEQYYCNQAIEEQSQEETPAIREFNPITEESQRNPSCLQNVYQLLNELQTKEVAFQIKKNQIVSEQKQLQTQSSELSQKSKLIRNNQIFKN